jgi:hypothetical protein
VQLSGKCIALGMRYQQLGNNPHETVGWGRSPPLRHPGN